MVNEKFLPDGISFKVSGITENEKYVVVMFEQTFGSDDKIVYNNWKFVQTEALTVKGVAVQKYGAIYVPLGVASESLELTIELDGTEFTTSLTVSDAEVGTTLSFGEGGGGTDDATSDVVGVGQVDYMTLRS